MSQATVSRALRDDPRIPLETRTRVAEAAKTLEYVPSRRGRSLSTRSSGQVGIVVSDLGNPFYLQLLDEIHSALREVDMRMLVLTTDNRNSVHLAELVDGSLDGVILTTTLLGSNLPDTLSSRRFPFVLLNRETDEAPGDVCVADNHLGAALVAREMLRLGHTRIAAIFGPTQTSTGRDREAGFRAVLEKAGAPLPVERWRRCEFDFDSGYRAALELLDEDPSALFCANDIIALGAFNALRAKSRRIPEDITLIGFDDVLLARWEAFRLTTVAQDIRGMAQKAVELLLSRLASDPTETLEPRRVVFEPRLIRRHTHGPVPVSRPRPDSSPP